MPLLPSLFSHTLPPSTNPPLILITDSILQPGVLLLRSLIASSLSRNEAVIVLALEQTPSRLLPRTHDASRVDFVDCLAAEVDLHGAGGARRHEEVALEAVRRRKKQGGKIVVVLDSVDELAEEGVEVVYSLVRKVLRELQGVTGSRLIALHHAAFPSPRSSSTSLSASLLPTLLSPSTSSSTIHLTLHPSALLELLSRDYGLAIPLHPSTATPLDLRLPSFLTSFASRSWGDPFILPPGPDKEDERVPLDEGGKGGGGCVVEWTARGVNVAADDAKRGEPKKIVVWGIEGLREKSGSLEPVGLKEVLSAERMARVNIPTTFAASSTPATKSTDPPLPFNLSLTDSQKAAREEVVLPYLPREDGQVPGLMFGGGIEYVPDEGDDMDDDDPDEDLEV
ncbi:hypothetical protein RQP46_004584 [Phenoliferia psychrophenolica]